ncbi:MAG: DoxX family protein [Campylobacter sp.]
MNMININFGLLFVRLGLGVCLLMHGIFKLTHGIDGVKSMLVARGIPDLVAYGAYVGEVLAPAMIIIGVFCRIGALLVIANVLMIIYVLHTPLGALTGVGGFELEIVYLYLSAAFCLVICGGGEFVLIRD